MATFKKELRETDEILADIADRDTKGIVTDEFREEARSFVTDIVERRRSQAVEPHGIVHRQIFLNELYDATRAHRDKKRDDGSPYIHHLIWTARNAIHHLGRTRLSVLVGSLWHDSSEDLGMNPDILIPHEEYGVYRDDLTPDLRKIRLQVGQIVRGVTKVRGVNRDETSSLTFRNLLSVIAKTGSHVGLDVAYVKLADRLHNMSTIGAKSSDKQKLIAAETERLYIPLALVFDTRDYLAELVPHCLSVVNPDALEYYHLLLARRLREHLNPFHEAIEEPFRIRSDKNNATRHFLKEHVRGVEFRSLPISDFIPGGMPLSKISEDDLSISPTAPLFEIVVLVASRNSFQKVIAYINENFSGGHEVRIEESSKEPPLDRGVTVKILNTKFGGTLVFRLNDEVSDALAKRGIMAQVKKGTPRNILDQIKRILAETEGNEAQTFAVAEKRLLREKIRIFTPSGKEVELHKGGTSLDFAAGIHRDLCIGIQEAEVSGKILDNTERTYFVPINRFSPLEDGTVVRVRSCLAMGDDRDPQKIQADPGFHLFCEMANTHELLTDYLVERHMHGDDDMGENPDDEAIPAPVIECGKKYCAKISGLFGIPADVLEKMLMQHDKKLKTMEEVYHQLATGNLEPLRVLAQVFFHGRKEFRACAILPDHEGVLNAFTEIFRHEKLNLKGLNFPSLNDNRVAAWFTLVDRSGTKSVFDIMRIFLKLSYDYDVSLVLTPEEGEALQVMLDSSGTTTT